MANIKTILLTTSTANDVAYSRGFYNFPGLTVKKSNITNPRHVRYKAEVPQVLTIDTTAATSPLTSKAITVNITVKDISGKLAITKAVFNTPATITDIGSTAALQNEAVNSALVTKLNGMSLPFTAASLGSGEGITITDTAGYFKGNRGGVTGVSILNFTATTLVTTTAGTYAFGVGADLASNQSVSYISTQTTVNTGTIGGLVPIPAPLTTAGAPAVSGQRYDAFVFTLLRGIELQGGNDAIGYREQELYIFVDNGKGSSTTNAAGFLAFEKTMHLIMADLNKSVMSIEEPFDSNFVLSGANGGSASTSDQGVNTLTTPYGQYNQYLIGAATINKPAQATGGWNIENDATATEGSEIYPAADSKQFIVGKSSFQLYVKEKATTVANSKYYVGFRKKGTNSAVTSYGELACIFIDGGTIKTIGNKASGTAQTTASSDTVADASTNDIQVIVKLDGTVTAKVGTTEYAVLSAASTPLILTAGTAMIPFQENINVNSTTAVPVISQMIANESVTWLD